MSLAHAEDPRTVLGVGREASKSEIKAAFREKAQLYHPDRHATADETTRREAEEKFKEVRRAFELLYSSEHDFFRQVQDAIARDKWSRHRFDAPRFHYSEYSAAHIWYDRYDMVTQIQQLPRSLKLEERTLLKRIMKSDKDWRVRDLAETVLKFPPSATKAKLREALKHELSANRYLEAREALYLPSKAYAGGSNNELEKIPYRQLFAETVEGTTSLGFEEEALIREMAATEGSITFQALAKTVLSGARDHKVIQYRRSDIWYHRESLIAAYRGAEVSPAQEEAIREVSQTDSHQAVRETAVRVLESVRIGSSPYWVDRDKAFSGEYSEKRLPSAKSKSGAIKRFCQWLLGA